MDLEKLLVLKDNVKCDYIEGVYIEIISCLERLKEQVKDYVLYYHRDSKTYRLKIVLSDFGRRSAKNTFIGLLEFVAYSNAMYVRKISDNKIVYCLLTSNSDEVGFYGFYLEIVFLNSKDVQKKLDIDSAQRSVQDILVESGWCSRGTEASVQA